MKCSKCHQDIPDGSAFCLHCGAQLHGASGSTAKPQKSRQKRMKVNGNNRKKRLFAGVILIAAVVGIAAGGKAVRYNKALKNKEEGNYPAAMVIFEEMDDYRDAEEELKACNYLYGQKLLNQGNPDGAKVYFQRVGKYQDAKTMVSQCDYQKAEMLLNQGSYSEAEALFASLEEFGDSKEQVRVCQYHQAEVLFASGDYEAAKNLYMRTNHYLDAETKANECLYQLAQEQLAEGDYKAAYEHLCFITDDYKDSEALVTECLYRTAEDYYAAGDYSNAYNYVSTLRYHRVDKTRYDMNFLTEVELFYIEDLIKRGENVNLEEALALLDEMQQTQKVKNLISQAQKQKKQNIYDDGVYYLQMKQYSNAIREFEKIKDFSDTKQQWQAAVYGFVRAHESSVIMYKKGFKESEAEQFYEYAKLLSDQNYRDSREFYKELTGWHMDITMNASENSTMRATSVSKYDMIYAHLKLSGGPLDGETKIRYVFTFPSGSTTSGNFEWLWKEGDTSYCYCYYNDPYRSPVGTCYVKIYDGAGNLIGQDQIRVTY